MTGINNYRRVFALFLGAALVSPGILAGGEAMKDGTYRGEHSFVTVAVTVSGGRIAAIEMIRHGGGGEEYAEMVRPLLGQMVEMQSTEVDIVTGATVSSNHLKKAVAQALQQAASPE